MREGTRGMRERESGLRSTETATVEMLGTLLVQIEQGRRTRAAAMAREAPVVIGEDSFEDEGRRSDGSGLRWRADGGTYGC